MQLFLNMFEKKAPNLASKYYLLAELFSLEYRWQNVSVSNIVLLTAVSRQALLCSVELPSMQHNISFLVIKHQTLSVQLCGQLTL